MMKKYVVLFYFVVFTIPVFLGLNAWQSSRYISLKQAIRRLEKAQSEWVESNKRLVVGISVLSSPSRIEHIARREIGMSKIKPENVQQIKIQGGNFGR
jgi:cell division protein FtsL